MRKRKAKNQAEVFYGEEPIFSIPITDPNDFRFASIFNWYNSNFDSSDGKKWVKTWMRKKYTSEEILKFEQCPDIKTPLHLCVYARLENRGMKLPDDCIKKLIKHIKDVTSKTHTKPTIVSNKIIFVQDKIKEKISETIGDIENILDEFYNKEYIPFEPMVYDLLQKKEIKKPQGIKIYEYYHPLLLEITDVKFKETEGYEKLTKKQLTNYVLFVHKICSEISRYSQNVEKQQIRKPRKKKEKSALQLIKRFKYKKEDSSLKIVSIDPTNIVGASMLWYYNTKYKKLTQLISEKGLSIKGTTIINFDKDTSKVKTLRKPEDTIKKVLDGGKVILRNLMENLTTKEGIVNGRINNETILLRVIK
jgi:hypothetical protein